MNQIRIFPSSYVLLIIIFLLLQLQKSQCIDEHYLGCEPASCRDGNDVTFPFHIVGKQPDYCGYPGFEVRCSNTTTDHSIIELFPNESYAIHEFFYPNQSIKVSNLALWNFTDTNTCLPSIENLTLHLDDDSKFEFGPDEAELLLFYGCNKSSPEAKQLSNDSACFADGTRSTPGYAIFGMDPKAGLATRVCENQSVAPISAYEYKENETGEKRYLEALNSGFLLEWKAPDCSTCSDSGGRCGFNTATYQFQCYCHDRPHLGRCPKSESSFSHFRFCTFISMYIVGNL
ncbi:Wall-associated receptor kinase, C-terminal [Dillenia turbinata]|uniref:non-specific serine/threonine protein kinase n=1 Tax=Dillenia turbinata TaxID=194707 RepID=A0AAN8V2V9_9MAGN